MGAGDRDNSATTAAPRPGVNVVGHVTASMGMGLSVRSIVQALLDRGHQVAILDVDPGGGRKSRIDAFASHLVQTPEAMPFDINLFVLGPQVLAHDVVGDYYLASLLTRSGAINAAFTFWELPVLPQGWVKSLSVFDALVAASPFVRHVLQMHVPGTHVLEGKQPISLPGTVKQDRRRFGIDEHAFVAVLSFDPSSDIGRKNPFAAICAFKAAFPSTDAAQLVIKINHSSGQALKGSAAAQALSQLSQLSRQDARLVLIERDLDYAEVLSLYASADVYLSLHRSEGFGLGLLEAMGLGKPVVATGWSGNMAFMDWTTACPVRCGFIRVEASNWAYTEAVRELDPYWADADIEDAASWLRRLANSHDLRTEIGTAAKAGFERYRAAAAQLGFMDEILYVRDHIHSHNDPTARRVALEHAIDAARAQLRQDTRLRSGRAARALRDFYSRHIGWRFRDREH